MSELTTLPTVELGMSAWPDFGRTYHLRIRLTNAAGQPTIQNVNAGGIKRQGDVVFAFAQFPWIFSGASVDQYSTNTDCSRWPWFSGIAGLRIDYINPALYNIQLDYATINPLQVAHEPDHQHAVPGVSARITVSVPQYKIDKAWAAKAGYAAGWSMILNAAAIAWCWWISAPLAAAGTIAVALAAAAHNEANGCPRFVPDYTTLGDHRGRLRDHGIDDREEMAPFKKFIAAADAVFAIRDTAVDTRNRYLSALKMRDKAASGRQKKHIEALNTRSQKATQLMRSAWEKAEASVAQGFEKAKADPAYKQSMDKLRSLHDRGLSAADRDHFAKQGLNKDQIDELDRRARALSGEELAKSPATSMKHIFDQALAAQDETTRERSEVQRIDALLPNDQLRTLMTGGLLTASELEQRRDHLERETSYPIWEVWAIGTQHASALIQRGTRTTGDLLARCKQRSDRTALAKELGVERELVDRWVQVSDLLRVEGVGIEEQSLLERFGVKSAADLAGSKADALHKRLTSHFERIGKPGAAPARKRIDTWIARAGRLGA
jgi:hypothetical protein